MNLYWGPMSWSPVSAVGIPSHYGGWHSPGLEDLRHWIEINSNRKNSYYLSLLMLSTVFWVGPSSPILQMILCSAEEMLCQCCLKKWVSHDGAPTSVPKPFTEMRLGRNGRNWGGHLWGCIIDWLLRICCSFSDKQEWQWIRILPVCRKY